jgi:hypothetical protein
MGFGFSATQPSLWKLTDTVVALEVQDIGLGAKGSLFRHLHVGGETKWKLISLGLGVNQGYLCAGLGFDLKVLKLDLATFGEEMGLNTGTQENRVYALRFALQI